MRLHGVRALGSLAFLSTITSAAPVDNDIEAISGLVARDTWNDDYGSVPVGSFSIIIENPPLQPPPRPSPSPNVKKINCPSGRSF